MIDSENSIQNELKGTRLEAEKLVLIAIVTVGNDIGMVRIMVVTMGQHR